MMDNDNILETTGRGRLTADVTYLMLKGLTPSACTFAVGPPSLVGPS